MPIPRDVLTPAALAMLETKARTGSFAAAARASHRVSSFLSYRVRQMEEAVDALLIDRGSRQARRTAAGAERLREGACVLANIKSPTGSSASLPVGSRNFPVAVNSIIRQGTVRELCEEFRALKPPTRLKLRAKTLSGTLAALRSGEVDLALGVHVDAGDFPGLQREPPGTASFVFAVAPRHALANNADPLGDEVMRRYLAVTVADTVARGNRLGKDGLLAGQDIFTVTDMPAKLDAQIA